MRGLWTGWGLGNLLRRGTKFNPDTKLLNGLCRITRQVAQPVVYSALLREVEEAAQIPAGTWIGDGEMMLQDLLRDPGELVEGLDKEKLCKELAEVLQADLQAPDGEEVREHSHDLARMMTSAWLEVLRDTLSRTSPVVLARDLRPPEEAVQPELWHAFTGVIAPFAVTEAEAAQIRTEVGGKLFSGPTDAIALPLNLCLKHERDISCEYPYVAQYQPSDDEQRVLLATQTITWFDSLSTKYSSSARVNAYQELARV